MMVYRRRLIQRAERQAAIKNGHPPGVPPGRPSVPCRHLQVPDFGQLNCFSAAGFGTMSLKPVGISNCDAGTGCT